MKIAIGSDHRGFLLKQEIQKISSIDDDSLEWVDIGAADDRPSDYPEYAQKVCDLIGRGDADAGVLICGNGIGMTIAANRNKGIFAALAWEPSVARTSKERDNANVLVFPSDYVTAAQANAMLRAWMTARFEAGRHERRLLAIDGSSVIN